MKLTFQIPKRVAGVVACLLIATGLSAVDCYRNWLNAYDGARATYMSDTRRCTGPSAYVMLDFFANSRCLYEANSVFGRAIDRAGAAYEECVYNS